MVDKRRSERRDVLGCGGDGDAGGTEGGTNDRARLPGFPSKPTGAGAGTDAGAGAGTGAGVGADASAGAGAYAFPPSRVVGKAADVGVGKFPPSSSSSMAGNAADIDEAKCPLSFPPFGSNTYPMSPSFMAFGVCINDIDALSSASN